MIPKALEGSVRGGVKRFCKVEIVRLGRGPPKKRNRMHKLPTSRRGEK